MPEIVSATSAQGQPSFKTPVSYEDADRRAHAVVGRMSAAEKLQLVSGHNNFYIRGFREHGIPELYMSDATQGVHLRDGVSAGLDRSTAFPSPIALAASWNPDLAYRYACAVGEECRAGGIAFLLGPGMNIYRISQCGRNFEYFGEDPFLASRMVEAYVRGVLDTGTVPTLKHFVANNSDFRRRTSNSIVDERTLHEIYLPAFQAGVRAGAMAVMTAYNQLNGEWCGQSRHVITELLRGVLGYRWLVMTDWWSVWDAEKLVKSGQDLEMPGDKQIRKDGERVLAQGKVSIREIDRMATSVVRTCIAAGLYDRPVKDDYFLSKLPEHEQIALATAREGIVLLKNDGLLPLRPGAPGRILLTGAFAEVLPRGGGSAEVEGYGNVTLIQALAGAFGSRLVYLPDPTDEQIRDAAAVLLSTGTFDSEGWDRPFDLPPKEEARIVRTVGLNPRTAVIVNSGGGIRMADWNDRAAAIVYAWYPGQIGNRALAEVLSGEVNPSGKLPITIERRFEDSPGFGYVPPGESLYAGWEKDGDMSQPINGIRYEEGVFVGYRWYESKRIAPLYAFGHGLSYTTFAYRDLKAWPAAVAGGGRVNVEFTVTNTGAVAGAEVAQLYASPPDDSPVARPAKEMKAFAKMFLQPGESRKVHLRIKASDFAYWDAERHDWAVQPGRHRLLVGGGSNALALEAALTVTGP
ncbi:MAG: beta-glucosidase [Opitutaceae bacterium]